MITMIVIDCSGLGSVQEVLVRVGRQCWWIAGASLSLAAPPLIRRHRPTESGTCHYFVQRLAFAASALEFPKVIPSHTFEAKLTLYLQVTAGEAVATMRWTPSKGFDAQAWVQMMQKMQGGHWSV